jgi:hypothetical protein
MINWLRRRWRRVSPRYHVACPACGAASNPMALDVAGLWAALHAHLCPAGATEDDLVLMFERG